MSESEGTFPRQSEILTPNEAMLLGQVADRMHIGWQRDRRDETVSDPGGQRDLLVAVRGNKEFMQLPTDTREKIDRMLKRTGLSQVFLQDRAA